MPTKIPRKPKTDKKLVFTIEYTVDAGDNFGVPEEVMAKLCEQGSAEIVDVRVADEE